MTVSNQERVALISMPWMGVDMPSIQLATLATTLRQGGVAVDTFHFFVDYAAAVGPSLYRRLSDVSSHLNEYVFCRRYLAEENGENLVVPQAIMPQLGIGDPEADSNVLDAVDMVTEEFLDRCLESEDWSRYTLVGFSLTIAQTAASMALARRLKKRHPAATIVFGGSSCAGVMGAAIARACPYVDVVARSEGELVLRELTDRIRRGRGWEDLPNLVWREGDTVRESTSPEKPVYTGSVLPARNLDYDDYFQRLEATGISDSVEVWLPFESSRGCWYGEKAQCRFCGLHEIMRFRSWESSAVLTELERLATRYGITRFFSVDLIMPTDFYTTFLPEIEKRGHDWTLFYEIKANARQEQVEALARAGVRWIQPGIESLDDRVLRLMRKGVNSVTNVQLLRLCAGADIRVTWNIIAGIPGEKPDWYADLAVRVRSLYHLPPPTGVAAFELHRFSPYFDDAESFGIRRTGATDFFRAIFPFDDDIVDDLAYRHGYELDQDTDLDEYIGPLRAAIAGWHLAASRQAALTIEEHADGSASIDDTRDPDAPRRHSLTAAEGDLYRLLATPQRDAQVVQMVNQAGSHEAADPGAWGQRCLDRWHDDGLIWRSEGRSVALAVNAPRTKETGETRPLLPAPVPYLGSGA